MSDTNELSASLEDYLETIFHVVREKQAARAKDIATRLAVNNSSVTGALRSLSEKGLINYAPYDLITLTPPGTELAKDIVRRHEALKEFFQKILCVEEPDAEDAACKMEHAISRPILDKLIQFVEFVDICPRGGENWIQRFGDLCETGPALDSCQDCMQSCVQEIQDKKEQFEQSPREPVLLKELVAGQKATVQKIKGRDEASKRLAEMKITPGSLITVESVEPSGEPINIKIKGYHLTLSKSEASKISVIPVGTAT